MQSNMSKDDWVLLFHETGLDDAMMKKWHRLFESKYPDGHQSFLEWLKLPEAEIEKIRSDFR